MPSSYNKTLDHKLSATTLHVLLHSAPTQAAYVLGLPPALRQQCSIKLHGYHRYDAITQVHKGLSPAASVKRSP